MEGETTMREPIMWSLIMRRRFGRQTAISLWPPARWQAETLQSSESTGGETVWLQRAGERLMMQSDGDTEKGHDSEEDWVGSVLGEPILVTDLHSSQRCSQRTLLWRGCHVATRQNCMECFP